MLHEQRNNETFCRNPCLTPHPRLRARPAAARSLRKVVLVVLEHYFDGGRARERPLFSYRSLRQVWSLPLRPGPLCWSTGDCVLLSLWQCLSQRYHTRRSAYVRDQGMPL